MCKQSVQNVRYTMLCRYSGHISLVKVISCCTSRGRMVVGLVVKTRQVDKKSLNEFIDVEEAYQRIDAFITTRGFLQLPIEEQKEV